MRFALLVLLVAAAAALRFSNINWDQFQHVHPDERFIVWVADSMSLPRDLGEAFDPMRSPLNPFRWPPSAGELAGRPRAYAYGHFPLYLLLAVAHTGQALGQWLGETTLALPAFLQPLHTVGRHLAEYNYLTLVGRAISALADLGTLLLVYWLAGRAYGRIGKSLPNTQYPIPNTQYAIRNTQYAAGLLAAAAYAFAVLPIQLSHYAAVDALLTFCVTATVALAVKAATVRPAQHAVRNTQYVLPWLAAGILAGLAVGSKFSAVLLCLPLLAAALYDLPEDNRRGKLKAVLGRLSAVGFSAAIVFAVTNPFAVIEFVAYVTNIVAQQTMVSGLMDAPYTRQYIGTTPYLYFVQQLSQWGLGWPLGLAAWGGFAWALVRAIRSRLGGKSLLSFGPRGCKPLSENEKRPQAFKEAAAANPLAHRVEVIMLAWAVPYFLLTGGFHTKFPRYMAPLLPCLLVFGAGAALALGNWLRARWGRRGQIAWAAALTGVAIFTVGWALAFTGIYRQEHPWIQASRWIVANIPADSRLLSEHWDDTLPLALSEIPGRPEPRTYRQAELPLWDPDTPAKLDKLAAELSSSDYVILASNRLYAPMARLPGRYPLTSQYYRLLFAGDLGYVQVAEFSAYPTLAGLTIRDDHADESFTVYDHPRALIFANQERLSESLLRARLGRYLPQGASQSSPPIPPTLRGTSASGDNSPQNWGAGRGQSRPPGHARHLPQAPAPTAPLTLAQPVDTLPAVNDFRWNRLANDWHGLAALLWYLVLGIFGWAAWPLLFPLFRRLPDRGYALARAAGWLLIGWLHWIGVSLGLWQNRVGPLALILAGLAVCGAVAWRVQRRQIAAFWGRRRRLILGTEALFILAYGAFVIIRMFNPDLWQPWNGGEKFMEFAFLNAVLRSPSFPPYDPYFAGGILNYYYYGLYLVALPIKLTGIAPEIAFNLAVPALFALTAVGVFGVGYGLAGGKEAEGRRGRCAGAEDAGEHSEEIGDPQSPCHPVTVSPCHRVTSAALAVVLALLMGNQAGLGEWLRGLVTLGGKTLSYTELPVAYLGALARGIERAVGGATLPRYDYWTPSRVIPFTINEFPLWTFLFADLHPHMIALPFGLLVAGIALNWVLGAGGWGLEARSLESVPSFARISLFPRILVSLSTCLLLILALGSLGAINTWDFPTYLLLVSGALLLAGWRSGRWWGLPAALLAAGTVGGLALAAYAPFHLTYQPQLGGTSGPLLGRYLAWVDGSSPLAPWLTVWAFFLFLAYSYVAVEWLRAVRRLQPTGIEALAGDSAFLPNLPERESPPTEIEILTDLAVQPPDRLKARFQQHQMEASPPSTGIEILPGLAIEPPDYLESPSPSTEIEIRADLAVQPPDHLKARFQDDESVALFPDAGIEAEAGLVALPPVSPEPDPPVTEFVSPANDPLKPPDRLKAPFQHSEIEVITDSTGEQEKPAEASNPDDEDEMDDPDRDLPEAPFREGDLPPAGPTRPSGRLIFALALIGMAALLAALDRPTAALTVIPLGLALAQVFRRDTPLADNFLALILALGLAILAGTELIYLRDFLGGSEWYRMNTLFKFGVPAWTLLGLTGGIILLRTWRASHRLPGWLGTAWRGLAGLLLLGGLAFVPLGIPARVADRFPGPRPAIGTLDGMAFMTVGRYTWPDAAHPIDLAYDYLAIHWLLDNVTGSPVIAEAPAGGISVGGQFTGYDYYRAGGQRVASLTGFPTFVGHHQGEQRPGDQVGPRTELGQEFFRTTDLARAQALIEELRVGYIYIGTLERTLFESDSLRKFDVLSDLGTLRVVYRNAQVTIYRVEVGGG